MYLVANLEPVKEIGRGSFGVVWLFNDELHGPVAAKVFFSANFLNDPQAWRNACEDALSEARLLKTLEHKNVVRVFHVYRNPNETEFYLVTEFCDCGSAGRLTAENLSTLQISRKIIRDSAIGLNYIHNRNYIHRDFKTDNILLHKRRTEVKVADFGFVTDEIVQVGFATAAGTPCYLAPEVPVEGRCTAISDVYSVGVTFIHLLHGDLWFCRQGKGQFFDFGEDFPSLQAGALWLPHIPTSWKNCIKRLTHENPSNRCQSMDEAVNSISRLPLVEDWSCQVTEDHVQWSLPVHKSGRVVRVDWNDYLRKGESWTAWSENLQGGARKTLGSSARNESSRKIYRDLQKFFQTRNRRVR